MNFFDKMRQQKLMSIALLVFTLSVGILIGTLVNTSVNAAKGQAVAPDATPLTVPKAVEIGSDFTKLAKKLQPSVVNIIVEVPAAPAATGRNRSPHPGQGDDSGDDPLEQFRGFFGGQGGPQNVVPEEAEKHEQSGTGFIVDKNGYIVTNNHVVSGGDKIMVKLQGESTQYRAKVIGTDFETDLAVIKIDVHKPLDPVSIGNSDAVQVGDWAVAIGSPFTLEESVTAGIVSALGREIDERKNFQRFIQTDAAINPGNSGGPLVNIRGEVIGVNTMIATSRGGSEGVGFALPSNMVVRVYNDIIRDGSVSRGSVGISFRPQKPETLEALGVNHGVIVDDVTPNGPSAKAGIKVNDIVVAINGQSIKDGDDLLSHVADAPVGSALALAVDREGKKMDFKVVTQDRKLLYADRPEIVGDSPTPEEAVTKPEPPSGVKFGIGPRDLTEDERNLTPDKHGVMVTTVQEGSFAEDIEMEKGDIIISINRHPVSSADDVRKIAASLKSGDAVAFQVVRPAPVNALVIQGSARKSAKAAPAVQTPSEPTPTMYLSGRLP